MKTSTTTHQGLSLSDYSKLATEGDLTDHSINLNDTYRVLVCDDDDVDREKISRLLSKLVIATEVDFADSENAVLDYLDHAEKAYDCIILDYQLGTSDGIHLLQKYANDNGKSLPVIMITGFGDERIAVEAMRLGAYDYLSKNNLSSELLGVAVEGVIKRTALNKRLQFAEEKLLKQSLYDDVTGLTNRFLFFERLEQHICKASENNEVLALFLFDLDRFKQVNDTFGHIAGDRVLAEVGQRLSTLAGDQDTVSRIGGDEFALLLPNLCENDALNRYAQNVIQVITDPIIFDGTVIHMGASMGIATFPQQGTDSNTLYLHADRALYESKDSARSYTIYSGDDAKESPKALAYALPQAIRNDELFLEFQPKICLQTGAVTSAESLVRWQHPTHGRVMPGSFLPDAERTGVILNITLLTMRLAVTAMVRWKAQNIDLTLAVNISARVLDDKELPMKLREVVLASGLSCEDFINPAEKYIG